MDVLIGVYIPGEIFNKVRMEYIVHAQNPAISKGAYHGKNGVKQRVIIVDSDDVKSQFVRLLLDRATFEYAVTRVEFNLKEAEDDDKKKSHQDRMAELGQRLALSNRIVSLAEFKENHIKLAKLYLDVLSGGAGSEKYKTEIYQQPTLDPTSVPGSTMEFLNDINVLSCGLLGNVVKVAEHFGVELFVVETYLDRTETVHSSWQEFRKVFDEHGLHCKDIRILSPESGDRVSVNLISSASDRKRARSDTSGPRAADEQLAECLRSSPYKDRYGTVSGYQGRISHVGGGNHLIRGSLYCVFGERPPDDHFIRQKLVRVSTKV